MPGGAVESPVSKIKLPGAIDEWTIAKRRRHDQTADDLRDLTFVASKVGKQLNTSSAKVEAHETAYPGGQGPEARRGRRKERGDRFRVGALKPGGS